jgi:hypothetical protein
MERMCNHDYRATAKSVYYPVSGRRAEAIRGGGSAFNMFAIHFW